MLNSVHPGSVENAIKECMQARRREYLHNVEGFGNQI